MIAPGPTDSRLGYYAFATVFKAARKSLLSGSLPVMITGNPETPLNLISIEDVVDGIVAIVGQPTISTTEATVFHLTHPNPISLGAAFKAPLEWMDLDRHVTICDPDRPMPLLRKKFEPSYRIYFLTWCSRGNLRQPIFALWVTIALNR